jgi:hypothetical protein
LGTEFTVALLRWLASNSDRYDWLAEFLHDFGKKSVRFVCHPAAVSFTQATKQGCAIRPLALAEGDIA